ncbi:MAG: PQQ-binding-like beta-propeller repeat protein, partial [Planctomycetota bacterium]
ARALAAAGDSRAARWATQARALGGAGAPEEALSAAPLAGRPARVVARRAIAAEFQGSPAFHATAGDIAATTDPGHKELVAFAPSGRVLWRWRWAEPQKLIDGRFQRTRTWDFGDLLALPDAFLLVVREEDSVQHEFNNSSDFAGAWLALIDARTGETRSLARAEGQLCDPTRPSLAHAGRLFVSNPEISAIVATDIHSARTAWVRPLPRASSKTDPDRIEVLPRLAARDGLLFVPSPHGSRVMALRMIDGTTAWETATPGPAVDVALDGEAIWACAGDSIVKLEAATGRILLQAKLGATVIGAPARLGDVLSARTRDGWLRGISATDATEKWKVFVGPAARLESLIATDGAFFLCRRDNRDVLPSWVVTPDGRALRRLYLRFTSPPENWRGSLLVDDLFGRRQAFCLPAGGDDFSPLFPSGLLLVDGAAMVADDAGAIARVADGKPPQVAAALASAALAIDPENPEALAIRIRLAPPADANDPSLANALRADAWRALDAFPPLDPRRGETLKAVEAALSYQIPLLVKFDSGSGPWVDELRLFNALHRLARAQGDRDAIQAVAESGLRGATDFLPPADFDPLSAVARLRCGEASVLAKVISELHLPAGTARMEAAEALAWRDEKEAVDALRQHLGEGEPVRVRLSAALACASDAASFEVLEKFGLPSDDDAIFLRSASILLAAGRPKAIDALANPENSRRFAGDWDSPLDMLAASTNPDARARLEAMITPRGQPAIAAARALLQRDRPRGMKAMAAALEKCEPRADNERWLLQMISPSEVPEIGPAYAGRAKALLPSEDDISWPAVHHMIAESLDVCGKGAEARKFLDTYGAILPDTAETNNNTAWFMAIARTPEMRGGGEAIKRALRAVAAEPWNASYLDTLAEAYRADRNWKEACSAAGRALELSSTDRDAMSAPYYERQVARMKALRDSDGASDGR